MVVHLNMTHQTVITRQSYIVTLYKPDPLVTSSRPYTLNHSLSTFPCHCLPRCCDVQVL
jgi:hypothetical protein